METKTDKYSQKIYGIVAISLLLFSFYYYGLLFFSCYGALLLIVQFAIGYCLLKAHDKISPHAIISSAILPTVLFLALCVFNTLGNVTLSEGWHYFSTNATMKISLHLITGCMFLFTAWIAFDGKEALSHPREKCITQISAFATLSVILAIALTEKVKGSYNPETVFVLGLLLVQLLCSYNLYKLSSKWYMAGNVLFSLFIISVQINMLSFHTELIRSTGWAVTYITSVILEMLALYGGFAVFVSLIPYLHHKISVNKGITMEND